MTPRPPHLARAQSRHGFIASAAKGLVMRLFGAREVTRKMESSLGRLAATLSASPHPGP